MQRNVQNVFPTPYEQVHFLVLNHHGFAVARYSLLLHETHYRIQEMPRYILKKFHARHENLVREATWLSLVLKIWSRITYSLLSLTDNEFLFGNKVIIIDHHLVNNNLAGHFQPSSGVMNAIWPYVCNKFDTLVLYSN